MAPWGLPELLLRNIAFLLAGANWQRSGGKGRRPKPIELPDARGRGDRPKTRASGEDIAQRLRNLGLIPAGDAANPPRQADPSADELASQADVMWLERQKKLATE